jgi:nitroreductase
MNVLEAIRERRAVRDFKPEPVSAGLLYQLVSAASWAPSAMNEQPWHFTIVTDRAMLDEISRRAKSWLLTNLPAMPRSAHFRDILAEPDFNIFYNASCLVVISTDVNGPWMCEDASLAAQNMMLMATDLGLGSCWIGFAQGWLNSVEGRQLLNLSDKALVVAPLIVGYPRTLPPPVPRKAPLISWIGSRHIHGEKIAEEPELPGVHPDTDVKRRTSHDP